jgi:5-methylcytosine-specific restriction endonuclease McrA
MRKPRRKCKACKEWFHPAYSNIYWCSPDCGTKLALAKREEQRTKALAKASRKQLQQDKIKREEWRKRKAALKPIKHWIDLTQRAVNDLRRETCLANGDGCISCGTHDSMEWQAGHYRSTAAASHLRFEPDNIWLQCFQCNVHKSGNIEAYRSALVWRIGQVRVQQLENDNKPYRWTVEELERIRLSARAGLRNLKKLGEAA